VQRVLRIVGWILFAVVALAAGLAMVGNRHPIALRFLDWATPEAPVYWWLVGAFVLGCVCGWLISGIGLIRARTHARRTRAELDKTRSALASHQQSSSAPTG
jgi:uncharacterized integral membrane protein